MIFATVGTQLPFDRLLAGLDSWAALNPGIPILAQSGRTARMFQHISTVRDLDQTAFRDRFAEARLVVAHAGMGTILSATELGKPVILMPRLARFGEHRNDHQRDTAAEMARLSNVTVVEDGEALHAALDAARARGFAFASDIPGTAEAAAPLIAALRDFVWSGAAPLPRATRAYGRRARA
ncbi:MAG: glycosyltransferase family 28 protein [Rhodobacteraceae bacterium]|jgi:UDP-N-acetylglucosamine transferase subunit ALG13|nr:glycosyltransferase family 28 protein [Paracoccaceae bacterium]